MYLPHTYFWHPKNLFASTKLGLMIWGFFFDKLSLAWCRHYEAKHLSPVFFKSVILNYFLLLVHSQGVGVLIYAADTELLRKQQERLYTYTF